MEESDVFGLDLDDQSASSGGTTVSNRNGLIHGDATLLGLKTTCDDSDIVDYGVFDFETEDDKSTGSGVSDDQVIRALALLPAEYHLNRYRQLERVVYIGEDPFVMPVYRYVKQFLEKQLPGVLLKHAGEITINCMLKVDLAHNRNVVGVRENETLPLEYSLGTYNGGYAFIPVGAYYDIYYPDDGLLRYSANREKVRTFRAEYRKIVDGLIVRCREKSQITGEVPWYNLSRLIHAATGIATRRVHICTPLGRDNAEILDCDTEEAMELVDDPSFSSFLVSPLIIREQIAAIARRYLKD